MTPIERSNSLIEVVIDGCQGHGRESDPDHEVGDLQIALRLAWRLMSAQQRRAYMTDPEIVEIMGWSTWPDPLSVARALALQIKKELLPVAVAAHVVEITRATKAKSKRGKK